MSNNKTVRLTSLNRIFISVFILALLSAGIFSLLAFLHYQYHSKLTLPYIFSFFIAITLVMAFISFTLFKRFLHSYLYKLLMRIRETSEIWSEKNILEINDKDELAELEDNIETIVKQITKKQQEADSQNKVLQVLSKQQKYQLTEIRMHMDELLAIYNLGKVINSNLNLDSVIDLAVSTTSKIMKSPLCSVRILDPESKFLVLRGSYGLSDEYLRKGDIRIGESIAGRVVLDKQPIAIEDVSQDSRIHAPDYAVREGITSLLCVPLIAKNKSIGVITIYSFEVHKFSDDEIRLLSTFASQISVAIENARLYEETRHLAITDGLTNIYNHKFFREQLALETHRAERYSRDLSLIMIDVDNFKLYNDTYGHPAGDLALIQLAKIIMNFARKIDIVARYGGEEFTIILPETDCIKALDFADRIRNLLNDYNFIEDINKKIQLKKNVSLTISAGISTFPTDAKTDADLINNADHALYMAKNSGKNRVCIYGQTKTPYMKIS